MSLFLQRTEKTDRSVNDQKNADNNDHDVKSVSNCKHETNYNRKDRVNDLKYTLVFLLENINQSNDTLDRDKVSMAIQYDYKNLIVKKSKKEHENSQFHH